MSSVMSSEFRIRKCFFDNLKHLSTDKSIFKLDDSIDYNPHSSRKLSQTEFQNITHFLFKTLDSEECKRRFRGCFPALDQKQSSDFRKATHEWLKHIKEKEYETLPKVVPIYLQNPCTEAFYHLYLEFSNYVIINVIQRAMPLGSVVSNLFDCEGWESIGSKTKYHLDQYQTTRLDIKRQTDQWITDMQYFIETNAKLTQSLESAEKTKASVYKTSETNFDLIIQDIEELNDYSNQLENDIKQMEHRINEMDSQVNKKWGSYRKCFESQTQVESDEKDSLISTDSSIRNHSFVQLIKSFENRIKIYEMIATNVQTCDLETFFTLTTEMEIDINKFHKHSCDIISKLKSMVDELELLVKNKRDNLLINEKVIERRKWFKDNIKIDFSGIGIEIKPKKRELKSWPTNVTPNEVIDRHEDSVMLNGLDKFNYSFQLMDVSAYGYIPPSGSHNDSLVFSPVHSDRSPQ